MTDFSAFTLESHNGLLRELKTGCEVSLPFMGQPNLTTLVKKPFVGLWDTGASGTCISPKVVQELNLQPTGSKLVFHAQGSDIVDTYLINLFLPNQVIINCLEVATGILTGMDVLIGMDVIANGDFSITNHQNKTKFSFRIPSIKHIDYLKEAETIAMNRAAMASQFKGISQNALCPCGSGQKYKRCHGSRK